MASYFSSRKQWLVTPESMHINKDGEHCISIVIGDTASSIPCLSARNQINSIDSSQSDIVVIKVVGVIEISDLPLLLPSRTMLEFHGKGCLRCTEEATSDCLVLADSCTLLGIRSHDPENTVIDGYGRTVIGIYLRNSSSCHIDGIGITSCGAGGIVVESAVDDGYECSGSITRCTLRHCTQGVTVTSKMPFLIVENFFFDNSILGLLVQSSTGIITANRFERNRSDIFSNFKNGTINHNLFKTSSPRRHSLRIDATPSNVLIFENEFCISIDSAIDTSTTSTIIAGSIAPFTTVSLDLAFDCLALCRQLSDSSKLLQFQFDVYVWGSSDQSSPTDVLRIRDAIAAARTICGESILVVRAEGYFVSNTPEGLEIPPDTCLIISGTISAGAVQDSPMPSQLLLLAQSGFVAVIGGTLHCNGIVDHAVSALGQVRKGLIKSSHFVLINSVEMIGAKKDGVYLKARRSSIPFIIFKCTIQSCGSRGIWIHVTSFVYVLNSIFQGNQRDGIDFDAGCKNCAAVGNICAENLRHGIFIEEGACNLTVIGNECFKNVYSGIHVWNEAVNGCTSYNIIAFNICRLNTKGIAVGGRTAERTVKNNCFFNNICCSNSAEGMVIGNTFSERNAFVHSVIRDNGCFPQSKQWGNNTNIHFNFQAATTA